MVVLWNRKTGHLLIRPDKRIYKKINSPKEFLIALYDTVYHCQQMWPENEDEECINLINRQYKQIPGAALWEISGSIKWKYGDNIDDLQIAFGLKKLEKMGVIKKNISYTKHPLFQITDRLRNTLYKVPFKNQPCQVLPEYMQVDSK